MLLAADFNPLIGWTNSRNGRLILLVGFENLSKNVLNATGQSYEPKTRRTYEPVVFLCFRRQNRLLPKCTLLTLPRAAEDGIGNQPNLVGKIPLENVITAKALQQHGFIYAESSFT